MPTLPPETWATIRYDYEYTDRPIPDICAEHGISAGTLRDRMRRWKWQRRRPPIAAEGPAPASTSAAAVPAALSTFRQPEELCERRSFEPAEGDRPGESPGASHPNPLPAGEREQAACAAHDPTFPARAKTAPDSALALFPTLPLSAEGSSHTGQSRDADRAFDIEPSPHLPSPYPPPMSAPPIVQRLQGAVDRVLPAIEATLGRLADTPARPRDMEQMARALGALTRTLRELNTLLAQQQEREPQPDPEALRRSIARKLEAIIQEGREERPRQYLAAWEAFAAEAEAASAPPGSSCSTTSRPHAGPEGDA